MPDEPTPPPDPEPGKEWEWKDKEGKKRKIGLCRNGAKTCKKPKPQGEEIWCLPSEECEVKDKPCFCMLFSAHKKKHKEWEPTPPPKQGKKHPYDPDYFYACFCVRFL